MEVKLSTSALARGRKMTALVLAFVLLLSVLSATAPGAGGTAQAATPGGSLIEPVLWLKADEGVQLVDPVAPAPQVSGWTNVSPIEDGVQFTYAKSTSDFRAVTYNEAGVNFNPSLKFLNYTASYHYLDEYSSKFIGNKPITVKSAYAVVKWDESENNYALGTVVGHTEPTGANGVILLGGYGGSYANGNGNTNVFHYNGGVDRTRYQIENYNIASAGGTGPPFLNTAKVDGAAQEITMPYGYNFGPITLTPVIGATFGGDNNWGGLLGNVAEIILFDKLTTDDAAKIETYLAVKYGITLNSGESDYVATNGDIVWETDGTYKSNIAGVGRDDAQGLYQKQSHSINTGPTIHQSVQPVVAVQDIAATNATNEGTLANGQYAIWGDNGEDWTFSTLYDEDTSLYKSDRVWKLQSTADISAAEIGIPTVSAEYLLVSASDSFEEGQTTLYPLTLHGVGNAMYYSTALPIPEGDLYFAFGAIPPKVEQTSLEKTTDNGNRIAVKFDRPVQLTDFTGFVVNADGTPVTIEAGDYRVDEEDWQRLIIDLPEELDISGKVFTVSYDGSGNLKGTNTLNVAPFDETAADAFADALTIAQPSATIVNVKQPAISGTAAAGATVDIAIKDDADNTVDSGTVTANENGQWSFELSVDLEHLKDYTIVATASDDVWTATKSKDITVVLVDKTALQAKADEINGGIGDETLKETDYSPASWAALASALDAAEAVLADPDAAQGEVDDSLNALNAAYDALAVDKTALQAKADEINDSIGDETLKETDYSPTSWAALASALDAAEAVLTDPNAAQSEVDDALAALTTAHNALATAPAGLTGIMPSAGALQPNFDKKALAYSISVGNSVSQLRFTVTPVNPLAALTVGGVAALAETESAPVNLNVGRNTIQIVVTEPNETVTTYTVTVTRQAAPVADPTPVVVPPPVETITVDVEAGDQGTVAQTQIRRSPNGDGTKNDLVTFEPDKASEAVDNTLTTDATVVRIVIPDANDDVSEVRVELPTAAVETVQAAGLDLEIYTDNGIITIPNSSLGNTPEDFYFRLVPIKKEEERRQVEERARQEEHVREVLADGTVYVVDRPITIETNLSSRPVDITLPIDVSLLPSDAQERAAFLANLVIFVEHGDGDRELVKPQIVDYADGQIGLKFGIAKFSTFTVLNMSTWAEYLAAQEDQTETDADGAHHSYIKGFVDGSFQPDKALTRGELAAILSRILELKGHTPGSSSYSDVSDNYWAHEAIGQVTGTKLMVGYTDGTFRPGQAVSRAEMAVIISRWQQLASAADYTYNDVSKYWAEPEIAQVSHAGYMLGYANGSFKPDQALSRAEAVVVINRVLGRGPLYGMAAPSWSDVSESYWAYRDIEEASREHAFIRRPEGGETIVE